MRSSIPLSEGILTIPLRVQNANAISSPLTHGFPSITAFMGLMWALERKLEQQNVGLLLNSVGVVCHHFQELTQDGYVKTFRLTRNPVDKSGKTSAIVEEGRMHMDLTLVLGVSGAEEQNNPITADEAARKAVAWQVAECLSSMRVAGGTVLATRSKIARWSYPKLYTLPQEEEDRYEEFRKLRRQWLPGFALVCRDDLLHQRKQQLQSESTHSTLLDAWLDLSRFNWRPEASVDGQPDAKVEWQHDRPQGAGWLVPIPVGFGALTDLHAGGEVDNARDSQTPFRFVENLYSVGQWLSPHRLDDVNDLLWYAQAREDGVYRCCNDYSLSTSIPV